MDIERAKSLFVQVIEFINPVNQSKVLGFRTQKESILIGLYSREPVLITKVQVLNHIEILVKFDTVYTFLCSYPQIILIISCNKIDKV